MLIDKGKLLSGNLLRSAILQRAKVHLSVVSYDVRPTLLYMRHAHVSSPTNVRHYILHDLVRRCSNSADTKRD